MLSHLMFLLIHITPKYTHVYTTIMIYKKINKMYIHTDRYLDLNYVDCLLSIEYSKRMLKCIINTIN